MSKPTARRGDRPGFTMIELLTVIGIIVILMSILIPVISEVRKIAQNTDTTHLLTKISTACHSYYAEFRAYPGPLPDVAIHGFPHDMTTDTPTTASIGLATALNLTEYNAGTATGVTFKDVTASQNLILGLLGGLSYNVASTPIPIVYDPTLIPKGPQILNPLAAQQITAYIDPGKNDLSQDSTGAYVSMASLPAGASSGVLYYAIPEFIDHYSIPSPIIYLRARTGASYACDIAPVAATGTLPASLGSQYYSAEMAPYAPNFFVQPDHYNNFQTAYTGIPGGAYGLMFFSNQALDNYANNTPRGKDSFILISAGYDGFFGTKDDIVLPSN